MAILKNSRKPLSDCDLAQWSLAPGPQSNSKTCGDTVCAMLGQLNYLVERL